MACPEDQRLQQIYEAASDDWKLHQQKLQAGYYRNAEISKLRAQLKDARWNAADALYRHSVNCLECMVPKSGSF
jgi:hypothetical protein